MVFTNPDLKLETFSEMSPGGEFAHAHRFGKQQPVPHGTAEGLQQTGQGTKMRSGTSLGPGKDSGMFEFQSPDLHHPLCQPDLERKQGRIAEQLVSRQLRQADLSTKSLS